MNFLVISKRAYPSNTYSLKDLTGHGRIDILFRCILAASRALIGDDRCDIICLLQGKEPNGWLWIQAKDIEDNWDEIEVAAFLQKNWSNYFQEGNFSMLRPQLHENIIYLHESGIPIGAIPLDVADCTIVLGAQKDLSPQEYSILQPQITVSLGNTSLLASQVITYFRQKLHFIS